MISGSQSPTRSPTRSPHRQALSSKDSNTLNSPQLKLNTPQFSPQRQLKKRSQSPIKLSSRRSSPVRSSPARTLARAVPSLGFKIFEDPVDYTTLQHLASANINDENDTSGDKENQMVYSPLVKRPKRRPLGDLDLSEHAGYIHYHPHHEKSGLGEPRKGTYLLDTVWTGDEKKMLPSYVTPPRFNRVRYVSFTQDRKVSVKRSSSANDIKDRVVKKLVFDIHRD